MSFTSRPLQITLSDLNIELGFKPPTRDQDYHNSQSDQMSYDSMNAFDIFKHSLSAKGQTGLQTNQGYNSQQNDFMQNIVFRVERARIKFQDHYFAFGGISYSITLTLSSAEISRSPGSQEWTFKINGLHLQTEIIGKEKTPNVCMKIESLIEGSFTEKELKLKVQSFNLDLNKDSIQCLQQLFECVAFKEHIEDLDGYKPLRKPIPRFTICPPEKRRLVIRDWLHYVVWFVRVRKLKLSHLKKHQFDYEFAIKQSSVTISDQTGKICSLSSEDIHLCRKQGDYTINIGSVKISVQESKVVQEMASGSYQITDILGAQTKVVTATGANKQKNGIQGKKVVIPALNMTDREKSKSQNIQRQSHSTLTSLLGKSTRNEQAAKDNKFFTLLDISASSGTPGIVMSKSELSFGDVRMVDLQSEQLLKMVERFLKASHYKIIVKELVPMLYLRQYTNSLQVIINGLTKNPFLDVKKVDSFTSEIESQDGGEYIVKALSAFELRDNWKFELQSLAFSLRSYSKLILQLNVTEKQQVQIKLSQEMAEMQIGRGISLTFPSKVHVLKCLLDSLNRQIQPLLLLVSYDANMGKLRDLIQDHFESRVKAKLAISIKQQFGKNYNQNQTGSAKIDDKRMIDQDLPVPHFQFDDTQFSFQKSISGDPKRTPSKKKQSHFTKFTPKGNTQSDPQLSRMNSTRLTYYAQKPPAIHAPNLKVETGTPRQPLQSLKRKSVVSTEQSV